MVQVLQSQKEAHVTAYRCLIKRTVWVTRCGFTSISYGLHIVEWRRTLAIEEEDCRNLIKTRQIKLGRKGEEKTLTIRRSGTLAATIFMKGNLDRDGNCEHATSYLEDYITQSPMSRPPTRSQQKSLGLSTAASWTPKYWKEV